MIGLDARTVQRWRRPGHQAGDLRAAGKRRITVPANKFSLAERQAALALINSDQFKDLPPSQIVAQTVAAQAMHSAPNHHDGYQRVKQSMQALTALSLGGGR